MQKMYYFKNSLLFSFTVSAVTLLLLFSSAATNGAKNGLLLCGNVIIPSLFPISVAILFLIKTNALSAFYKFINPFSQKIFRLNANAFFVMLLSLIGGYPVGAKLVSKLKEDNAIDNKTAKIMLCYCTNGGPAFIIIAVGENCLGSKRAGILLFLAHILASVFMALILARLIKTPYNANLQINNDKKPLSDLFVEATADAAKSILTVCTYVILFSTFINVLKGADNSVINKIIPLLEVTSGIFGIKNIYLISALLGFAGISIHCQIFSLAKNISFNKALFILARVLHASISVLLTFLLLKIFPVSLTTISNNIAFSYSFTAASAITAFSLIFTGVVFVASCINNKGTN